MIPKFAVESIAAWPEQWDDFRIEILRTVDIEEHVVATVHQTGRGKSIGVPVETRATMVFTVRQGKLAEWRIFLQEDEALEAAGLGGRAMSNARLEYVARQFMDGIRSRDLAAIQAACDPDIEFTPRLAAVEGKTYRGYAGWSDYLGDLEVAWEAFHVTIEEFVPAAPGRLVLVLRVKAVARGSHVPIDQRVYAPWEFRQGKALRGRTYPEREQALEAVGLPE